MTYESLQMIVGKVWAVYSTQLWIVLFFATLFTILSMVEFQSQTPGKRWWRNPGLATDVSYFLVHTGIATYFKLPALLIVTLALSGMMSPADLQDYFANGRGPLGQLPFWAQVPVYMLLADLLLYWIHRIFHKNGSLWPFHAIHHSSRDIDWTSSFRFHPVNVMMQQSAVLVLMLTLGIRPEVIAFVMPFDYFLGVWQHSNSRTTLGPFKYILATPVFHRWHHTLPDEGGDMNFAPTFAFWDWAFGTFYMPEGKLPTVFGTDDPELAEGYFHQLMYPVRRLVESHPPTTAGSQPPAP
jgi:sterol desaturase/sphingolipid hydroxylase (fatty acid hydroxylase superfamily)